jgi:hypothetical protein
MSWNYRAIRLPGGGGYFEIRAVYYGDGGEIRAVASEPAYPGGESLEEIGRDLDLMREALSKEHIDVDDLPFEW